MPDNYEDYDREELIKLLRERDRRPRFGLVWEGKKIEHERAINYDFVALDLDESLSCGDAPYQNLIIEGDNFDALRYLRMRYAGKVKYKLGDSRKKEINAVRVNVEVSFYVFFSSFS